MAFRRFSVCLKDIGTHPESIAPPRSFSSARRIARGAALGGLAGSLLGLGVEMAPEKYGLKQKTNEWLTQGEGWLQALPSLFKQSEEVLTVASPPVTESLAAEPVEVPPVVEEVAKFSEARFEDSDSVAESESTTAPEEEVEDVGEPNPIETVEPTDIAQPSGESEPPLVEEAVETAAIDEGPTASEVRETKLLQSVEELKQKLAEKEGRISELEGQMEATIETMDRLYSERQEVIGIARHSLVVIELLQSMAGSALSPGAMRVEFQERLPEMIETCFSDFGSPSFFKFLASKIFGIFFDISCPVPEMAATSKTGDRLRALQAARTFVLGGDFYSAVDVLKKNKLDSPAVTAWIAKVEQAALLWQGADAAVGSVHEDLFTII